MKLQEKLMLLGLTTLVVGGVVYTRVFIEKRNREELREIAYEIAFTWREKLDLSIKQTIQLERIIIIYTIRKNQILNADIPELAKIKKLQKVQIKEHKELRKILTIEQFEAYVGINKKIPNKVMDSLSA